MDMSGRSTDRLQFETGMSFKASERRFVEPKQPLQSNCVHPNQLEAARGELASFPDPKNTLDLDSLYRLRSFFELLDKWDQEENADEK
jgi:hypothetical protein